MTTTIVKGKDLQIGDKVVRASDGKVLTIRELTNGIYRNSRRMRYGRGGDSWATLFNNEQYEVVTVSTHSAEPAEK